MADLALVSGLCDETGRAQAQENANYERRHQLQGSELSLAAGHRALESSRRWLCQEQGSRRVDTGSPVLAARPPQDDRDAEQNLTEGGQARAH